MNSLGGAETFPVRPGSIVAHQGGWDEVLLVIAPLVVVGLALWLANRRVSAELGRTAADTGDTDEDTTEGDGMTGGEKRDESPR